MVYIGSMLSFLGIRRHSWFYFGIEKVLILFYQKSHYHYYRMGLLSDCVYFLFVNRLFGCKLLQKHHVKDPTSNPETEIPRKMSEVFLVREF